MAKEPKRFAKGVVLKNLSDGPSPTDTNPTCNIPGHQWVIDTNTTQTAAVSCIANACDLFTLATHGLSNGQHVKVTTVCTGIVTSPANLLDACDKAFVICSTACTFKLSTTSGGSAINVINCVGSVTLTVIEEQVQVYLCSTAEKVITDTNTVTMTNKTLNSPTLNCVTFGGVSTFEDDELEIVDTTDNTKKLVFDVTGTACVSGTLQTAFTTAKTVTLPDATDTLVGKATTDSLTNKTLGDTNTINAQDDAFTIDCAACATKQIDFAAGGTACTKTTISAAQTANRTITIPDATDTLVGKATTDTLTNKTIGNCNTINAQDDAFTIDDAADATLQIDFNAAGTTGTKTTITGSQTANRVVTIPDATDTLVGKATMDTLTTKTIVVACNTITTAACGNLAATELNAALAELQTDIDTRATSSSLTTHICDTTTHGTTGCIVGTSDCQTLTNKTITSPIITITDACFTIEDNVTPSKKFKFNGSDIGACTTRTFTLPNVDSVLVAENGAQTLASKTLTAPTINGGTICAVTLNGCISGTSIKDEDNMSSNSATHLATQQSIKAYVDTEVACASGGFTVTTKVAAYCAVAADFILANATCGAFTITLPAAACNANAQIVVKKIDSTVNLVTIDGNACETIDGVTSTNVATDNETLELISDGTNWEIIDRRIPSTWVNYCVTITADACTPPTKATTTVDDQGRWRRVGDSVEIMYKYSHTNATGAADGIGTYQFSLPPCLTIDNCKIDAQCAVVGSSYSNTTGRGQLVGVVFRSLNEDTVYLQQTSSSQVGAINHAFGKMTNASVEYNFRAVIPITGWKG